MRLSIPTYHETLWSAAFPGDQQPCSLLKPTLSHLLNLLPWTPSERTRIIVRSDAGLGTDANINWLLWLNFQVLMKGRSGKRAQALARAISSEDWLADDSRRRWLAVATNPPRYGRRTVTYVLRWATATDQLRYGTLVSSLLDWVPLSTWRLHDGRGAIEVEIKADKSGLLIPKRRKQCLDAQEALILISDLAHNILAWLHPWMLADSQFVSYGPERLVSDLLCIPGRVEISEGRLTKVALKASHPYAAPMRECLLQLLDHFGNP